ncbi:hypothetical protein GCK72_021050 [Caenorhabditis remanei]|uniref:Uncharacterized protein n=1 Tax=Caenorhabditis remanei TaxID=31234 RepID=A0A6A5GGY1_CAERE|nr:hypothetical protein GCK72_021050 [Caenorhabditis remanei]KAF1754487.1 hypothetical protein GCK72_021050 [Caenorhabditis remanei]
MTTKSILLCASLLGIAFLVVSAQPLLYTLEEIPKEEYVEVVKKLNDQKRVMVKHMNVAEGFELTWDPELVKQLNETYYFEADWDKNFVGILSSLKGPPGSNCHDGYTNNDGLCSLIPPTTTTEKPLTKPPGIHVTDATDVTSGSSSTCFLIGFLLFVVSFYSSY